LRELIDCAPIDMFGGIERTFNIYLLHLVQSIYIVNKEFVDYRLVPVDGCSGISVLDFITE
jgi:hypothetical protein